jgi:hypothetical protein
MTDYRMRIEPTTLDLELIRRRVMGRFRLNRWHWARLREAIRVLDQDGDRLTLEEGAGWFRREFTITGEPHAVHKVHLAVSRMSPAINRLTPPVEVK